MCAMISMNTSIVCVMSGALAFGLLGACRFDQCNTESYCLQKKPEQTSNKAGLEDQSALARNEANRKNGDKAIKIPSKVVYCKLAFGQPEDPFSNSESSPAREDLMECWVKTSRVRMIDKTKAHLLKGLFENACLKPLSEIALCGYDEAAILVDDKDQPVFAVLRMNEEGYFRLASVIVSTPDGYGIDLKFPQNEIYVKTSAFRSLLW
jgi:hypothetical protein